MKPKYLIVNVRDDMLSKFGGYVDGDKIEIVLYDDQSMARRHFHDLYCEGWGGQQLLLKVISTDPHKAEGIEAMTDSWMFKAFIALHGLSAVLLLAKLTHLLYYPRWVWVAPAAAYWAVLVLMFSLSALTILLEVHYDKRQRRYFACGHPRAVAGTEAPTCPICDQGKFNPVLSDGL